MEDVLSGDVEHGEEEAVMFPSTWVGRLLLPQEVSMLGADLHAVRLGPAVAGVFKDALHRLARACCYLQAASRAVSIRNQQDQSFLFSFQASWEGKNRHRNGVNSRRPAPSRARRAASERANQNQPRPRTAAQMCSWLRIHSLGQKGCSGEETGLSYKVPSPQNSWGPFRLEGTCEDSGPSPVRRSRVSNDCRLPRA